MGQSFPYMSDTYLPTNPRMKHIRWVSRLFRLISGLLFILLSIFAIYSLFAPIADDNIRLWLGTPQKAITSRNIPKIPKAGDMETNTINISWAVRLGERDNKPDIVEKLNPEFRWTVRPLIFCKIIFWIIGIGILYRLFHLYERGVIFTAANVRCLKAIGIWVLAAWALSNAIELSKLATYDSADIDLRINQTFFAGILVLLISWIMEEGWKIQEEHTLTI